MQGINLVKCSKTTANKSIGHLDLDFSLTGDFAGEGERSFSDDGDGDFASFFRSGLFDLRFREAL